MHVSQILSGEVTIGGQTGHRQNRAHQSSKVDGYFHNCDHTNCLSALLANMTDAAAVSFDLPLHAAVLANDASAVRRILEEAKVDPNLEDANGVTALIEACIAGYNDLVEILITEGKCPAHPPGEFRHSPIRGAAVAGQASTMKLLLDLGADPNALSDGNRTALMGACFLRKTVEGDHSSISAECVKVLLDDDRTDPTVSNSFGETALDLAKIRGYAESVELVEAAVKKFKMLRRFDEK